MYPTVSQVGLGKLLFKTIFSNMGTITQIIRVFKDISHIKVSLLINYIIFGKFKPISKLLIYYFVMLCYKFGKLPPEPTTCCMSGCANCVWIEYADKIAKLLDGNTEGARELVLKKIQDPNLRMFLQTELKLKMGHFPPSNTTTNNNSQPNNESIK